MCAVKIAASIFSKRDKFMVKNKIKLDKLNET